MLYNIAMSRLEISLLGPIQIMCDGELLPTNRRKAVALFAYLAVTQTSHSRAHLADLLWPDYERNSAFSYLRRTAWDVNQLLGKGWLISDRESIKLAEDGLWLDTALFRELTRKGQNDIAALAKAINLYRGDFLATFSLTDAAPFEMWQIQQAENFRILCADSLEHLANAYAQIGEYTPALDYGRRWLNQDPLNENAHRTLMRLLAGMGDRIGAIRQFESCAQKLQAELGIQPQTETKELFEAIRREDVRAKRIDHEEKREIALPDRVLKLPVPGTPFIGRQPEIDQIKSLITNPDNRLLTLVGPGGAGKSRLAIQVVSEVVDLFPNGVVFVSLAQLTSTEGMISTVAKALEFSFYREEESSRQQLLDYLREKKLLLLLDNFEHLIGDGARALVVEMLSAARGLQLLVTSRTRLNMQGEQVFPIIGMETPHPAEVYIWKDIEAEVKPYGAMQLFVDRARRVQPNFALMPDNLPDIARICKLVEGLPLGLELAATWLELLPPAEIASEISRSLDFLETDQIDVPDRQRSIRAVFESSWNLLTEKEREAFQRLSIFAGSFSREAAQDVSGVSLRTLLGLAGKSWLQQTDNGRFQLHELMRQYGVMRLQEDKGEWLATKDNHAAYFASFIERQTIALRCAKQKEALEAIAQEFDSNIPLAWDWLVTQGQFGTLIVKMLPGLYHYCDIRWTFRDLFPLLKSARRAVELSLIEEKTRDKEIQFAVLSAVETNEELAARYWVNNPAERFTKTWILVQERGLAKEMDLWFLLLARRYGWVVDFEEGIREQRQAIAFIREKGDAWDLGFALLLMGGTLTAHFKFDEGESCLVEALDIFQGFEAKREQAEVLSFLGNIAFSRDGDLGEYNRLKQASQTLYESVGDQYGVGCLWQGFAANFSRSGEHERAFEAFRRQRQIYEGLGNRRVLIDCLNAESIAALKYSTIEHAFEIRQQTLDISVEIGDKYTYAWGSWEMGEIYRVKGDFSKAVNWYEKANMLFESLQANLGTGVYHRGNGDIALTELRLEESYKRFQKYLEHAGCEHPPHIWGQAYAQAKLAQIAIAKGDLVQGQNHINEALNSAQIWNSTEVLLIALYSQALLFVTTGYLERALELAAFITHHPVSWNETKKQAHALLESASGDLPEEKVLTVIGRGSTLSLDIVIQQIVNTDTFSNLEPSPKNR